jgi:pilus assembly protein Flp/PilA
MKDEPMRRFFKVFRDEKGATAVEYGLILALIFLAMVVGVVAVGTSNKNMWDNVASAVSAA